MRLAVELLDVVIGVVALVVAGSAVVHVRRRTLQRRGGTFDCSLRTRRAAFGKGWMLGIARYTGESVEWYRVFSFSPRPKRRLARDSMAILRRRRPEGAETYALLPGAVIVECLDDGDGLELAMSDASLTGFLSWLEAGPSGRRFNVA